MVVRNSIFMSRRPAAKRSMILALLVFQSLGGCQPSGDSQARNALESRGDIVLITLDTTRADHLSSYGYFRDTTPNLDALARESVVFEQVIAPVAHTLPSHISLFTGTYPFEHGVTANAAQAGGVFRPSPHLESLAEVLARNGYATAGFVAAEPLKKPSGAELGFEYWWQPEATKVDADRVTELALEYLKERDDDRPLFLWVHYYDPHAPYRPPDPFSEMFEVDDGLEALIAERGIREPRQRPQRSVQEERGRKRRFEDTRTDLNAYDGELRFMDQEIGRLLDHFRGPTWEDLLVLVTADHGEALGQHGKTGHGSFWLEQLRVPLLMKIPGQSPRQIPGMMSSVAFLPTLAGLAPHLPLEELVAQSTERDALGPEGPRDIITMLPSSRSKQTLSILSGAWRWIEESQGETQHLYALDQDPSETDNVHRAHPEVTQQLSELLEARVREQRANGRKNEAGRLLTTSDGEAGQRAKRLEALGYVQ